MYNRTWRQYLIWVTNPLKTAYEEAVFLILELVFANMFCCNWLMGEENEDLERSINYWRSDARSERIGAFLTRILVCQSAMLTGAGVAIIAVTDKKLLGLGMSIVGSSAWHLLEKLAESEELDALNSEYSAVLYQDRLDEIDE